MSLIDTLIALAITVRNEKKKEANSNIRIGDLFLAIINFIKSVQSGEIRQDGVDTYNDTSGGKTSLLNKYPSPELNWTVLVRNDENNAGKASLYKWNGTNWVNLETVVYNNDVLSKSSVVNNLTDGGSDVPLSAEKGKTLDINKAETTIEIVKNVVYTQGGALPKNMASFDRPIQSENLFNKDTAILGGYFEYTKGLKFISNPIYSISDYIPVSAGSYVRAYTKADLNVCFFDKDKNYIRIAHEPTITVQPGESYITIVVLTADVYRCMLVREGVNVMQYIPYYKGEIPQYRINYNNIQPHNTTFFDRVNLFNKDAAISGVFNFDDAGKASFSYNAAYYTSEFISLPVGVTYTRVNNPTNHIDIFDKDKKFLRRFYSADITLQEGEAYVMFGIQTANIDTCMLVKKGADTTNYIPYSKVGKILPEYLPSSLVPDNSTSILFDRSLLGCLSFQNIGITDFSHLIIFGQSLAQGYEAPEAITTIPIDGNYMIGNNPIILKSVGTDLSPLIATKWDNGGEQPIVAMVNAFSRIWSRHRGKQDFIASITGEAGKTIEQLSKESTNGANYYTTTYLKALNTAKAAANTQGKTISCPIIVFMQGEYNYGNYVVGRGLTPGTDGTTDKDEYKTLLLTLKNNMQADAMAVYGQTEKPLFLVYQTGGSYIKGKEMAISMAQLEFAAENDDVILINPTYPMPDYSGGHLSTNGDRWYGELISKTMQDVFIRGERFNPVTPRKYTIDNNKILIDFYVPVLPLVFDNWTKEAITNNGFRVWQNNTEIVNLYFEIVNNRLVIACPDTLLGTIEVSYAGEGRSGSGNLRDSDAYISKYTYYDDRLTSPDKRENYTPKDKDGNYIYGKPYPMYNWCSNFYYKITV